MLSRSGAGRLRTVLPCARKEGESAVSRIAKIGARRIEHAYDVILEILFAPVETNMHRGDLSLAVDQKRSRQRVDSAINISHLLIAHQNAIVDFHLLEIRLHRTPTVLIHGDTNYGETAVLELLLEFH